MIEIERIVVGYGGGSGARPVVDQLTLRIENAQTTVLIGGSGAGKSTVLKAVLGIVPLQSGRILIDGEDCRRMDRHAMRRRIGMVFQGDALFPHMNVAENAGLALRVSGVAPRAARARAEELLHLVGLDPERFARRFPGELSGGQRQRVGLARALATSPAYLLMDEPFGALDAITRRTMQDEMRRIRAETKVTVLLVTHDIMEALYLGDCLAVMEAGRIHQSGPVGELLSRPASDTVRALVAEPLRIFGTLAREAVE